MNDFIGIPIWVVFGLVLWFGTTALLTHFLTISIHFISFTNLSVVRFVQRFLGLVQVFRIVSGPYSQEEIKVGKTVKTDRV